MDEDALNYDVTYTIQDNDTCIYADDIITQWLGSAPYGEQITGYGDNDYILYEYQEEYQYLLESDVEDNAINDFVDLALSVQQGNTSTTAPDGTEVAIFNHEENNTYVNVDELGTQIEYQTIYIRGDAPGGAFEPINVSYPVEFLSYDFVEVLTASFDGDLQLGDQIVIYYSNESFEWNQINLTYLFGNWNPTPFNWDGFIPHGAGLRFQLQSNATIIWTLPESDNGGNSDA